MDYKKAYLHLFNRITDIVELINELDTDAEQVDIALLLQSAQRDTEEICTKR